MTHDHSNVTIRGATSADVGEIAAFIRELADYERRAHEVTFTDDGLRKALFGERPGAEVLLAEVDGAAVGFALFFANFSTFLGQAGIYLEDLFVRPHARGQGIGRALLEKLAALAVERGCGRLEWSVLDWNEPAIEFYRRVGADIKPDWRICRLTAEGIDKLAAGE